MGSDRFDSPDTPPEAPETSQDDSSGIPLPDRPSDRLDANSDWVQALMARTIGFWPVIQKSEYAMAEWLDRIIGEDDPARATEILERLAATERFPPSRADWIAARKAIEAANAPAYMPALEPAPQDKETLKSLLGMMGRLRNVAMDPDDHDHTNGAANCPICSRHNQPHTHDCARCAELTAQLMEGHTHAQPT